MTRRALLISTSLLHTKKKKDISNQNKNLSLHLCQKHRKNKKTYRWWGSNPRPSACKADAITTTPHLSGAFSRTQFYLEKAKTTFGDQLITFYELLNLMFTAI